MKIPPLTEMEPVPPVPELPMFSGAATVSGGFDDICEEPPLDLDSDIDDDIIAGISAAVETGSMLDAELPKVFIKFFLYVSEFVMLLKAIRSFTASLANIS
jgi:hypothetical protein